MYYLQQIEYNENFKEHNLYIMRAHFQVRAKQKMLGNDLYIQKSKQHLGLYKHVGCKQGEEPEVADIERYKILLNIFNPNLKDLYAKIREACPEFTNKKSFYLYWKNSASDILPISNYITYLSMVSYIGSKNNNLYLIARDWEESWLNDEAATYVALPEDKVLVNMVAPKQSVFTATQEDQMQDVKAASVTEFTTTYNPPAPEHHKSSSKEKGKLKKSLLPKSKPTKKK